MTLEERIEINHRIDKMVGTAEQQAELTKSMSLEDRIRSNMEYRKTRERLFKIAEKHGMEALTTTLLQCGRTCEGVTASGKKVIWEGNNGWAERSRYCGSLWIEGIGTVFTSGTIAKAVEYLINN